MSARAPEKGATIELLANGVGARCTRIADFNASGRACAESQDASRTGVIATNVDRIHALCVIAR